MFNLILKALKEYNCQYSKDFDGEGLPLVDVITPEFEYTIALGKKELELLAEHIADYLTVKKGQKYTIEDLLGNVSLPEEIEYNCFEWACKEEIIKYPIAPRYAKAILSVCGKLLADGLPIESLINKIKGD